MRLHSFWLLFVAAIDRQVDKLWGVFCDQVSLDLTCLDQVEANCNQKFSFPRNKNVLEWGLAALNNDDIKHLHDELWVSLILNELIQISVGWEKG